MTKEIKKYIPFVIVIIVMVACKDDDTDSTRALLVGEWEAISETRTGCTDSENDGETVLTCSAQECIRYTFSDSSTYNLELTQNGVITNEAGGFSVSDKRVTLCFDDEEGETCRSINVIVGAETLSVISDDENTGCTITQLFSKQ
ncbi:MAG: hypothetical protein KI790_14655 [Cyclobacteriaceae bacterium]|nr:hypothetical protein [Cyclobacteriaceae bacterium HetDA_MAG_MS6]